MEEEEKFRPSMCLLAENVHTKITMLKKWQC